MTETQRRLLVAVEPILGSVPFIDEVNIWIKALCGVSTLTVAFFAVRSYVVKYKLDQLDKKIKEQRLARMEADYLEKYKNKEDL